MKLTNSEILNIKSGLEKIAEKEFPGSVIFDIKNAYKKILDLAGTIEDTRNAIIKKYGEEDGDVFVVKTKESRELYEKEYLEVLEKKVDVSIPKIPSTAFEGISVDMVTVYWLEKIIK